MDAITLWQFGDTGRLLSAAFTLPLQPIGTASNGAATTYLYQALNEATITTTAEGSPTVLTTFLPSLFIFVFISSMSTHSKLIYI